MRTRRETEICDAERRPISLQVSRRRRATRDCAGWLWPTIADALPALRSESAIQPAIRRDVALADHRSRGRRVLRFGSIRVVWQADESRALEPYVQLYVREEIRIEALVTIFLRSCGFFPWLRCSTAR